jgi:phosphoglycerate dehydrogenase-like enzyme
MQFFGLQDDEFGRAATGLARLQQEGTEVARLEELLAQSDVVSLHCPLTQETVKMLDEQAFRTIKRGALQTPTR